MNDCNAIHQIILFMSWSLELLKCVFLSTNAHWSGLARLNSQLWPCQRDRRAVIIHSQHVNFVGHFRSQSIPPTATTSISSVGISWAGSFNLAILHYILRLVRQSVTNKTNASKKIFDFLHISGCSCNVSCNFDFLKSILLKNSKCRLPDRLWRQNRNTRFKNQSERARGSGSQSYWQLEKLDSSKVKSANES